MESSQLPIKRENKSSGLSASKTIDRSEMMRSNQPIEKAKEIKQVCAWCDVDKSETEKLIAQGYTVSHGLCKMHFNQQMEELGIKKTMKGSDKLRLSGKIQKVNPTESRFTRWMQQVDSEIERTAGVSIHDLPDQDFRGAFDDGISPKSFAAQVLLEEDF